MLTENEIRNLHAENSKKFWVLSRSLDNMRKGGMSGTQEYQEEERQYEINRIIDAVFEEIIFGGDD